MFVFQHVQLLTQVNMLCSHVEALKSHAATTKLFLVNIRLIISPDNEKHKMQLTQFFLGIVVNVIS